MASWSFTIESVATFVKKAMEWRLSKGGPKIYDYLNLIEASLPSLMGGSRIKKKGEPR